MATGSTASVNLSSLEDATQYKNEGNVCYKKAKYDEAIIFYDKAINTCPAANSVDLATFYQNRAAANEQLKKWSAVKQDCTKALELNPRYVKALYRRARANEHTNDLSASLVDIIATCMLEENRNNSTLIYAHRILKQTGRDDTRQAMKTRKPTFPASDFVKSYFQAFTEDPIKKIIVASTNPKGFIRAKLALDTHDYENIIPACTEEIESSESEAEYKNEATLLRGTCYLITGSFPEASIDFDNIINNQETDVALRVNALIKKATLNVQNENVERGFENFSAAEKLDPYNADIYHHRAQVYFLFEQLEQAVKDFTIAVKLAPHRGTTYVRKCYAEYRYALKRKDQFALNVVMEDFQRAIDKFPDCVDCYIMIALMLTEQCQYEQADSFYDKAIKMAPTNTSIYVNRGIMQLQWNGDKQKAIDYMNKGIIIDDKCELIYEALGKIEIQRGLFENAVELYEKALKLAKSKEKIMNLYVLRNAAIAQVNVKKLGI